MEITGIDTFVVDAGWRLRPRTGQPSAEAYT